MSERTVAWGELLAETEGRLIAAADDNAKYCARLITEEAVGLEGSEFLAALSEPATIRGVAKLDAMVARRMKGEPIQYVIGHWPFRQLDLFIDRRVLIPRPETEIVAGVAIEIAARRPAGVTVLDLGTGSGAIGLSVASEVEDSHVWLTDQSSDALDVARANLAGIGHGARNVRVSQGSWFEALPSELAGTIDVIVTNPPYVGTSDVLGPEVKNWEPTDALLAGPDGLDDIRVIVGQSPQWLAVGGALVIELDPAQANVVAQLCAESFDDVRIVPDLAGLDRAVCAVGYSTGRTS
jgi:release factor glutamine methyltransferase